MSQPKSGMPPWLAITLPVALTIGTGITEGWKYALGLAATGIVIMVLIILVVATAQRLRRR